MENRRYNRAHVNLAAQFSAKGIQATPCLIKDFCLGGMLIDVDEKRWKFDFNLVIGDLIVMHLKLPTKSSFQNFQLKARIARIINNSAGLAFVEPDQAALQALENYSHQLENSPLPKRILKNDEQVQRVQALMRRCVADYMTALLQRFFTEIDKSLMNAAQQAKNNMVQANFLNMARELKVKRGSVITGFNKYVLRIVDAHTVSSDSPKSEQPEVKQKLELVNKEVFESWLVTKIIISKAEAHFSEPLLLLRLRLSKLFDSELSAEEMPFSPAVFCGAFVESLADLAMENYIEKVIYREFENEFVNQLGALYDELNGILINSGVLADITLEDIAQAQRKSQKKSAVKPLEDQSSVADTTSINNTHTGGVNNKLSHGNAQPVHARPAINSSETHGTTSNKDTPIAENDEFFSEVFVSRSRDKNLDFRNKFNVQQKIAREAYKTINNLLKIEKENRLPADDDENKEKPQEVIRNSEQVLHALDELQRRVASTQQDERITSTVAYLAEQNVALNTRDRTVLSNIDRLFEYMLPSLNNKELATYLGKLKLPVSKVVYNDESFYENQIHPARLLLNRVAEFDEMGEVHNHKTLLELDRVISSLLSDYQRDPAVFDRALEEINQLLDIKKKIYRKNVNRVTESCNGQQKLIAAKAACIKSLRRFEQKEALPAVLFSLVDAGWKEVMMLALLKPENNHWLECENIIEKCVAVYVGGQRENTDDLMRTILACIDAAMVRNASNEKALKVLQEQLKGGNRSVSYGPSAAMIKRFVNDEEHVRVDDSFENAENIWKKYPHLRKALVRAQNLYVGHWVELKEADALRRLRLAWVNDEFTRYAFVNQQGIKNREFSLIELVKRLEAGDINVVHDIDMPLVDKGLENMVQDAYGKLKYQSSHDQLTGLINRKEFDRLVGEAVMQAKQEKIEHAVCCINLDQFKVINNTCGLEAGDLLLKQIADILSQSSPQGAAVARLGNDEYGVLIKHVNESDAYYSLDNQIHLIENYRFDWKGSVFMTTASAGLAMVNRKTPSAQAVIKAASEACLGAKESGRNRIQVFSEVEDALVERQDVMEWIARLNRALDENKLRLRGQRISSVHDLKQNSHYEVLLSVEDENGVMLPPADFIHAAEKYNRMQAVDRWVIKHVFEWLHENESSLRDFPGLAINLSGHSMNDSHMLEYIFDLFVKLKVPRDKVLFEVTETIAISNLNDAADFIREMRGIGCRFALDDFGAGLSSYAYLKHLPVDYVKIDGAFIRNIVNDKSDYAMVKSINEMVKFLGMKTIAEYVENDAILQCLKDIGVDYAQGYLLGKPLPLQQIMPDHAHAKVSALH